MPVAKYKQVYAVALWGVIYFLSFFFFKLFHRLELLDHSADGYFLLTPEQASPLATLSVCVAGLV